MIQIIVIHSSREGTGKSTMIANLAILLASKGLKVGVVDADLQSGSLRHLMGLKEVQYTLGDYLFGRCQRNQVVYEISPLLEKPHSGQLFLVPATQDLATLNKNISGRYDISLFMEGLHNLAEDLKLDTLLIDTHAMLSDNTVFSMLSIAIADTLILVLNLDQKDYQGTGVMVDVARTLEVPRIVLIANQVATTYDTEYVTELLEQTYSCQVAGIIPYTDEIMLMGMSNIFVLSQPAHPIVKRFQQIADILADTTYLA